MWLELSTKVRFCFIDEPFALYRIHPEQASSEFIQGRGYVRMLAGAKVVFETFWNQCSGRLAGKITYETLNERLGEIVVYSIRKGAMRYLPRLAFWAFRYRKIPEFMKRLSRISMRILRG